jgi:RNA polymerase sigma factor (sigma-70 family)
MHVRRADTSVLSHDEQAHLFRRLQQLRSQLSTAGHDDEDRRRLQEEIASIRHTLAAANRGLCFAAAARFVGHGETLDELANEACVALMRCIDAYSPDKNVRFSTFCTVASINAIMSMKERNCRYRRRVKTNQETVLEQTTDYRGNDAERLSPPEHEELRHLIDTLPPRLRMIIRTYYGFDGPPRTIRQLARVLRVSPQRISQLLIAARDRLRVAYDGA